MMKRSYLAALLLSTAISLPGLALAEAIATVNGTAIDKKELDAAVAAVIQNSQGKMQDSLALREQLKGSLINRELVLQEARKRQLDKQPAFTQRLEELRNDMLREALAIDVIKKDPISEADIKARYDEIAKRISGTKEINLRQITVKSEADAQSVIAELKKGAKFENLVKSRSVDPNIAQSGGSMGWGNVSQMEPPLAAAVKDLGKGQTSSKPFQSPLGWHVFKVEDIRDAKLPSLDELKPQIGRQLQEEAIAKAVSDLRAKANIK
ncbi:peptidylprolyl isomerase [Neisseriaceae bacterium TC5R-5]|nr:peptidylprolyl isomerase [Neisseriaceae bacterium TC5R-5]